MSQAFPPALISRLRRYAEPFSATPPAIIQQFPGGSDPVFPFEIGSDKGLGVLLLCAALYAPGEEERSAGLIAGIHGRMGDRVFKLNRVPFEELRKNLTGLPAPVDPEARKRVPGILRSVCDFFYRVGALGHWLQNESDWERLAAALSAEIFWMGKTSRLRTKARYFLWLTTFQPDFAGRYFPGENFRWPLSMNHARFRLDFLRPKGKHFTDQAPEARLRYFTQLADEAFPGQPWRLYLPLSAYLRPDKEAGYACRRIQNGCQNCALSTACPSATQVKPGRN